MITSINLNGSKLNTRYRREKAQAVAAEMLIIVQSELFKQLVLGMDDKWRLGESSSYKNHNTTQIYNHIVSGKEEWNDEEADGVMDLLVDDYYSIGRVVGYMNPGKPTIYVNTRYFDGNSRERVGSNFLHEVCHTIGFRHSGKNLKKSFPYFINEVYSRCYDQLIKNGKPDIKPEIQEFKYVCKRVWWTLWIWNRCYKVYL